MKSLRFPVKGVSGLSLIFSEAFGVVVVVSAMVSSWCQGFDFSVSSIVESRSRGIGLSECQGFVVSEYRGVKVSECAVKILAHSLVSQHFC
jgi:hypothetical protein